MCEAQEYANIDIHEPQHTHSKSRITCLKITCRAVSVGTGLMRQLMRDRSSGSIKVEKIAQLLLW